MNTLSRHAGSVPGAVTGSIARVRGSYYYKLARNALQAGQAGRCDALPDETAVLVAKWDWYNEQQTSSGRLSLAAYIDMLAQAHLNLGRESRLLQQVSGYLSRQTSNKYGGAR